MFGAQQQGGNRQNPRAAAEIQHVAVFQVLAIEPFQAQRGGRVSAGAERQAWVQQQVHRVRLRGGVPARDNPQALAEAHRLEAIHPAAFPVLVFDHFAVMLGQRATGQQLQVCQHAGGVSAAFEQGQQVCVRPQRGGVEFRLEDRLIFGVHEGHRHGAHFKESVFVGFGLFWADGETDLQPRHGGHL